MDSLSSYNEFCEKRKNLSFEPGSKGFLISTQFITHFKNASSSDSPISPIKNNMLLKQGKLKPKLEVDKDFIVVDYEIWSFLQGLYKGGPEITVTILPDGTPEIYPLQINVRHHKTNRDLRVSRSISIKQFIDNIISSFSFSPGISVKLIPQGATDPLPTEGTVSDVIGDIKRIVIEIEETEKAVQSIPKVITKNQKKRQNKKNKKEKKEFDYSAPRVLRAKEANPPGLPNLGNTCYMNSALQCMLSLPHLLANLDRINEETKMPIVTPVFINFVKDSQALASLDPWPLKKVIGKKFKMFSGGNQQDSQEFTSALIDTLHDESSTKIIEDIFYGELESTTKCANCKNVSTVIEPFSILSLPISSARRVIYSPYDLSEPLLHMVSPPKGTKCVFINNKKIVSEITPDMTEIYALEVPDIDVGKGYACISIVTKRKNICPPILLSIDSSVDEEKVEEIIADRVSCLWSDKKRPDFTISYPKQFTMSETQPIYQELITVEVKDSRGFKQDRVKPEECQLSLNDLLHSFFSEIQLDDHNQWKCEKCGEKTNAYHKFQLKKHPKTLIIQFKRFNQERMTRDQTAIDVPLKLSFNEETKYDLIAISHHSGSLSCGHYTATGKRNGKWYNFNDSHTSGCPTPQGTSTSSYMLFYSQPVEDHEVKINEKEEEDQVDSETNLDNINEA